MPAKLLPADILTHYVVGSGVVLLFLRLDWRFAIAACVLAAVGREAYAAHKRGWTFSRLDLRESAGDIASTLVGGAVVLAAYGLGQTST